MGKTSTVTVRIEPGLKESVNEIFQKVGLSASEAITLFYNHVKLYKGLPFEINIPNEETLQVFKDTDSNKNLNTYSSVDELLEKLKK